MISLGPSRRLMVHGASRHLVGKRREQKSMLGSTGDLCASVRLLIEMQMRSKSYVRFLPSCFAPSKNNDWLILRFG